MYIFKMAQCQYLRLFQANVNSLLSYKNYNQDILGMFLYHRSIHVQRISSNILLHDVPAFYPNSKMHGAMYSF